MTARDICFWAHLEEDDVWSARLYVNTLGLLTLTERNVYHIYIYIFIYRIRFMHVNASCRHSL